MRLALLSPVLLSLFLGACAGTNPLVGGWTVDVPATRARVEALGVPLSESQRALLADPASYGAMSYVFGRDEVVIVYDGWCSGPLEYRVKSRSDDRVEIVFVEVKKEKSATLERIGDTLVVPVGGPLGQQGARQIFTPRPIEALASEYPCVRSIVGDG